MIFKAFSKPQYVKYIISGTAIAWFLGCFFILKDFGVEFEIAWPDALAFTGIFLSGIFVLELIFGFYIPKGSNSWLLVIIPLFLSFVGVITHNFILKWLFGEETQYLEMLKNSFFLRWAFLAIPEILISVIALVVSKLEIQEETQKREASINELSREVELNSIRQQLQPHFLFNSLNSISALVVSQPQKAREMVLQLSDFLRGTIRKDHKVWVSLTEELSYLKMYLDIERVRFGHRLHVQINSEELSKDMKLPQLLIQPLLENAIKHGLYGLTGDVDILVSTFKDQNYLTIQIENPFDPESSPSKGVGFGLSSVNRRLELLFGRSDLLNTNSKEGRFTVTLKIPQLK
ncbi:histidine kinase [Algoriphagus sp.]|uniref:sensor histidine kinase n=1 Tax=Algoriphagus sp. TaxID=1872435 RepID=UPI0025D30100|nr:histidine kinase [Algoriphagus sp.]